jgi:branched-chain amino acid transport system substrate-binding protein
MKRTLKSLVAAAALAVAGGAAHADLTIGVTMPLTGPASGLGIPMKNGFALWPQTIAGEKVSLIILDDKTDPTEGVKNARRFVTEDKVDVIVGSGATPIAIAMAPVAAEAETLQLALSPAPLPEGKDKWTFRIPHSSMVMGEAIIAHMKSQGVKTIGFIGYTDAYGETWLQAMNALAPKIGAKVIAAERFQRADTSVTGQALKLVSANPDAILVVASGSGAAMPHKGLIERGYKGKIYQTHAAASRDLVRVGGKDVEGAFVVSGPAVVAEQLPANHPSKAHAMKFVAEYEKQFGPGSRNQFSAHTYDVLLLLEKAVPIAMKKGKPGTKEFRMALRDAFEQLGTVPASQGVYKYSAKDHWGFPPDTGVILKVVSGDWQVQ